MGFGLELFKGDSGDAFRATVGNMSAPWLLLPLIAGYLAAAARRGALWGLASTMSALAGFYLGAVMVFGNHLGDNTGSFAHDLWFIVLTNKVWFLLGLVSGPTFGAIGATFRTPWHLALGAGFLLALEPAADWAAVQGRSLPLIGGWSADSGPALMLEVSLGLLILAIGVRSRAQRH